MFTGLVEAIGKVVDLLPQGGGCRLRVTCPLFQPGSSLGDSVAVDGCCLTVVALEKGTLTFELLEETLALSHLGGKQPGDAVHMERSLKADGRLGGHFVYGHIDGVGEVLSRQILGKDLCLTVELKEHFAPWVVPKGSIALDGVSLTVATVSADRFSVYLIPHTLALTHLGNKQAKDKVHLEFDPLGKYLTRYMSLNMP